MLGATFPGTEAPADRLDCGRFERQDRDVTTWPTDGPLRLMVRASLGMSEIANSDTQESGERNRLSPAGVQVSEFPVVDSGFLSEAGDVDLGAVVMPAVEMQTDIPGNELARPPQFTFVVVRLGERLRRRNFD